MLCAWNTWTLCALCGVWTLQEIHTRRIAQLESELAAEIDPVDWATYEAHL